MRFSPGEMTCVLMSALTAVEFGRAEAPGRLSCHVMWLV